MHTTNYHDTFISIADDCPESTGKEPPQKGGEPSVAALQFAQVSAQPYRYTSDDVLFLVHAARKGFAEREMESERGKFFSKGQACFRASPLPKRYGWGVHSNAEGRIAVYAAGSAEYQKLAADSSLKQLKAMRSKRG